MDDQFKKSIKKVLEHTEISMTRSLLRWKYKREGKAVPQETKLQAESRRVVGKANQVIAERGKNVWNELKKVYLKNDSEEEGPER